MHPYFERFASKRLYSLLCYCIGMWVVCVLASTITALGRLRALSPGDHVVIGMGPLHYIDIYKAALVEGYTLTFHFKSGLLVLALCCVVLELVVAGYVQYRNKRAA